MIRKSAGLCIALMGLVAMSACGSEQAKTKKTESPEVQITRAELWDSFWIDYRDGEHNPDLIGTWKGTTSTNERLVFKEDNMMEFQLHMQPMNEAPWFSEDGTLFFQFLWLDDGEPTRQSFDYEIDDRGHLIITGGTEVSSTHEHDYRKIAD